MLLKGLQKTTLLDYPERVACTVFTGGCNLRCPFCHNASLVLSPAELPELSEKSFFEFLSKRRGILDGVCVTGGEPLLQPDIVPFLLRIRSLGFSVKLDTNGSLPQRLSEALEAGAVDYVAMDIKNSKEKYVRTVGVTQNTDVFEQSIRLIMSCGLPYEFRTTVVKELHDKRDILAIAQSIEGAERYYLQSFKPSDDLISQGLSAHSEDVLREMLELVRPYVGVCGIRGI